jgi:hypothetical protein
MEVIGRELKGTRSASLWIRQGALLPSGVTIWRLAIPVPSSQGEVMKKLWMALMCLSMGGCTASCQNSMKHMKSDFVGLNRSITVYGSDGTPIKSWETRAKVEDQGGTCWFLDKDGKAVTISGTFIIEEK